MYTKEEIEKMNPEEKMAAFKSDFDELMRNRTIETNQTITLTDYSGMEEKVYRNGKVIAVKKI